MSMWLKIGLIVIGLALIVSGLMKIFGNKPPTQEALMNKFNEIQAPRSQIKNDLTGVGNILNGISAKEKAKNYAGAVKDFQTALAKLDDADAQIKIISANLSEFQKMVNKVSDQKVKTAGLHFIDLSRQSDDIILKMTGDTRHLVEMGITYFDGLANGKTMELDAADFSATGQKIVDDSKEMAKISADYDAATADFSKAAGFDIKTK